MSPLETGENSLSWDPRGGVLRELLGGENKEDILKIEPLVDFSSVISRACALVEAKSETRTIFPATGQSVTWS